MYCWKSSHNTIEHYGREEEMGLRPRDLLWHVYIQNFTRGREQLWRNYWSVCLVSCLGHVSPFLKPLLPWDKSNKPNVFGYSVSIRLVHWTMLRACICTYIVYLAGEDFNTQSCGHLAHKHIQLNKKTLFHLISLVTENISAVFNKYGLTYLCYSASADLQSLLWWLLECASYPLWPLGSYYIRSVQ